MSPWKVIPATLVIFCSGLVVGALLVKKTARAVLNSRPLHISTNTLPSLWHQQQRDFLHRIDYELNLTPAQRENVAKILKESQERTKGIKERIAPEMREELKKVREEIRAELTPEQQKKFEAAMKAKPPRKPDEASEETRHKFLKDGSRRARTNAPSTNIVSPANP